MARHGEMAARMANQMTENVDEARRGDEMSPSASKLPDGKQLVFRIATDERSVGAATAVVGWSVICVADTSYTHHEERLVQAWRNVVLTKQEADRVLMRLRSVAMRSMAFPKRGASEKTQNESKRATRARDAVRLN